MGRLRRILLGALTLVLAIGLTSAALASGPSFKTGKYKGKTSQGFKLTFVLKKLDDCVGDRNGALVLCLSQPDSGEGYLALKCADGSTSNDYEDVFAQVHGNGVVKFTSYPDGKGSGHGEMVVHVKVAHNGTICGYFIDHVIYPQSNNLHCNSGKVTFKAKRT
jgi:hypothetical protein